TPSWTRSKRLPASACSCSSSRVTPAISRRPSRRWTCWRGRYYPYFNSASASHPETVFRASRHPYAGTSGGLLRKDRPCTTSLSMIFRPSVWLTLSTGEMILWSTVICVRGYAPSTTSRRGIRSIFGSVASFRLRRFVVWSLPPTPVAKEERDDGDQLQR